MEVYTDKLEDIFMDDETYNNLGGNKLYKSQYFNDYFSSEERENQFPQWKSLDNYTKKQYIYSLVKNIQHGENSHYTYSLMLAILYVRHNNINLINQRVKSIPTGCPPLDEEAVDKEYRLRLISQVQEVITQTIPPYQIININPLIHTKQEYKKMIDDIYEHKTLAITLKDTSIFETVGHRMAFILFLDDMLTLKKTREEISLSVNIDTKQVNREKNFLDEFLRQVTQYNKHN